MHFGAVATFLFFFGAHMNVLSAQTFIKQSHRSPKLCWPTNLQWISYFEYVVQSLLNTCLYDVHYELLPNCIPLEYMCLIEISMWSRHGYTKSRNLGNNVLCFVGMELRPRQVGCMWARYWNVGTLQCYMSMCLHYHKLKARGDVASKEI